MGGAGRPGPGRPGTSGRPRISYPWRRGPAIHLIPTNDPAAQAKFRNPSRKHVTALAFHPSGRYLAVTSNDRAVRLHDRDASWAVSHTYEWNIGKLKSVLFSADSTLAAAGGEKGLVVVWDLDM